MTDLPKYNINAEDSEYLPLFITYKRKDSRLRGSDNLQNDNIKQLLTGEHTCYFIHQQKKKKDNKIDELLVLYKNLHYCMIVQKTLNSSVLRFSDFTPNEMVLPEEENKFKEKKCKVIFCDEEDIMKDATYYENENTKVFIKECFNLEITPNKIYINKDKDMWKAYLDGLNALLQDKRALIKIKGWQKFKNGLFKLDFDKESYTQSIKEAIAKELRDKYNLEVNVTIKDKECTIEAISPMPNTSYFLGKIEQDYCYQANPVPTNIARRKIIIEYDNKKLAQITDYLRSKLKSVYKVNKFEFDKYKNEFIFSSDDGVKYLKEIVRTEMCKDIADVVSTTNMIMPLSADNSKNMDDLKNEFPQNCEFEIKGANLVVSSKKSLNTELPVFKKLYFVSCKFNKDGKYLEIKSLKDLSKLNSSYKDLTYRFKYDSIKSTVEKLESLKSSSLQVGADHKSVIFRPQSHEEYENLKKKFSSIFEKPISAQLPKYKPTAKIKFKCEKKECRKGILEEVFENVSQEWKEKTGKPVYCRIEGNELYLDFNFDDNDKDWLIETCINHALKDIVGIRLHYMPEYNKYITRWELKEEQSLLQEYNRKLELDFKDENVIYIVGTEYDNLSTSQKSKNNIEDSQKEYIENNGVKIGICKKRTRDFAIIEPNEDFLKLLPLNIKKDKQDNVNKERLHSKKNIKKGDYIQFPAKGEMTVLSRQKSAMKKILKMEDSIPVNHGLCNFIFDPEYAAKTEAGAIETEKANIVSNKIMNNLNDKQLEAVAKSVLAKDLALIQGPPGTGKTTVIAEIIWQEIRKNPNCRILLTSQTNLAVDNALERLHDQDGIRPIRIGQHDKLESEVRKYSLSLIDSWVNDSKNDDKNVISIWIDKIITKISNDSKYSSAVSSWKKELEEKDKQTREKFSKLYKRNVNLVAATCSLCGSLDFVNAYSEILGKKERDMLFDVVIMDEASKATPLDMAVPLVLGKKIILIGDYRQLPPMMDEDTIDCALEKIGRNDIADKLRNAESQFKRLFEAAAKVNKTIAVTLDTQYRMHQQIMNTIKQFYMEELSPVGGLKCGIEKTMDIPDFSNKNSRWHGITLDPIIIPDYHTVWIDVNTPETNLNPGFKNEGEVEAVGFVLKALQQANGYSEFINAQKKPEDKEIGIITFYRAQAQEIKNKYKDKNYRIDVVDRFQGMERNIIIVSTVRSNKMDKIGFAKHIERINVAFSRARCLLIVVGNKQQFEKNENYAVAMKNMHIVNYNQLKDAVR